MSLLERPQLLSRFHNYNTFHMENASMKNNSASPSHRVLAPSFPPNEDVLLILHHHNAYPVPFSRVIQESNFLKKRYAQSSKTNPKRLRLPDHHAPVIVEAFVAFFNSNRRYIYPNLPVDHEIEFHIRICQLADDLDITGLWDEAFDRYTNRLSRDWVGLTQFDKERIVGLVYGECEVKSDRMMKNVLINEIGLTAIYLSRSRNVDDGLAYGHARLGFNSMVAIAAKVKDNEVHTILHDIQLPLKELTGLYLNARRYSLHKKLKSANLMWNEAAEMVYWKRGNTESIPEKEWQTSEEIVVQHWIAKMFDWYRQGYAKDELFDDNSRNPFGGHEDEIAEWCETS